MSGPRGRASVPAPSRRSLDPARATREARVSYREFLTYLFDREQTRELAVELGVAVDEALDRERLLALLSA